MESNRLLCSLFGQDDGLISGRSSRAGTPGDHYPALRAIDVSVQGRLVVPQDRVPSFYMKQMAHAIHQLSRTCGNVATSGSNFPTALARNKFRQMFTLSASVEDSDDWRQEP